MSDEELEEQRLETMVLITQALLANRVEMNQVIRQVRQVRV
jgi:hypothetical protein